MNSAIASSVSSDAQLLLKIKKLSWLSEAKASQLLQEFPARDIRRSDIIFEGHASRNHHTCILLAERAHLVSYSKHNGGTVIAMCPPGVITTIPAFYSPLVHDYQCKAAVHCRVLKIPRKRFIEIALGLKLPDNGDFDQVFDSVFEFSIGLLIRFRSFLRLDLLVRVAFALLELAENFGIQDKRGVILPHFFSHDDLADLVGASRPRVTSAVSYLEQQRIVGREGRQIVLDTLGLRSFIASHS